MMDPETIEQRIQDEIEDARVEVMDMTGGGDHFRVIVVSEAFEGIPMVKQHQMVYGALEGSIQAGEDANIHALGLKTFTPEEWEEFAEES